MTDAEKLVEQFKAERDTVINPIPRNDMWATKTLGEIQDYIEAFPSKQRAELYHVMMFTLNACHKMVKETQD